MVVESWSDFISIASIGLSLGITVGLTCLAVRFSAAKLENSIRVATSIR